MWVRIARFEGAQSVDEPVEEVRERMKAGMAQADGPPIKRALLRRCSDIATVPLRDLPLVTVLVKSVTSAQSVFAERRAALSPGRWRLRASS